MKSKPLLLISMLLVCNIGIWIAACMSSQYYHLLPGLIALAYGLGLRHAVDADHIAAIDNTTRKLMQEGQRPASVGLFFSLGHSTVVIILSILAALSATFVKEHLPAWQNTGSLIGTSVSSVFLLIIGIVNMFVLIDCIKHWQQMKQKNVSREDAEKQLQPKGLLTLLLRPVLTTVRHSWAMYPVGFLFGLGFDTASEVGLLSISAATGASGIPLAAVMLLPLAFTAGMALIDTLDGILMLGTYGWAFLKPARKLYYNMVITFISVLIALCIGSIEGMQLFSKQTGISGGIFTIIEKLTLDKIGYFTIGLFVVSWFISLMYYKFRGYDSLELSS